MAKCHLRSAFGKLGAASRTQAIAIAHRRGLLQQQTATLASAYGTASRISRASRW